MRPIPNIVLSVLLLALCSLCAWQWQRESRLRALATGQRDELTSLSSDLTLLMIQTKAADAEILRLTGALSELRANSIAKEIHDEALQANAKLKEVATQQNAAITQQNELLTKQNATVQQANEQIKRLANERDDLAKRLNEVTAKFNQLAESSSSR